MGLTDGKRGTYIRLCIAVVTLGIAIFDVITDWIALGQFVRLAAGKLAVALGIFCILSTLLFILELWNCVHAIRLYRNRTDIPSNDPKQLRLDRWQETVSFLLMTLEDIPNTIILYSAFRIGSCDLFLGVFEESNTANIALLGAFLSSLWKLLSSCRYCCCSCCNFHDVKGCGGQCCCCFARIIRPVFAIILMGFAAFLFFTFNNRGVKYRSDCFVNLTTVAP